MKNILKFDYLKNKTIPNLFQEQVQKNPDFIALFNFNSRWNNTQVTYRQLDQISGHMAVYLNGLEVREGHMVGIMVDRSIEMIMGILGILKTGSAYVPLNPKAPAARNLYIMEECRVKVLLTIRSIFEKSEIPFNGKIVFLEELFKDFFSNEEYQTVEWSQDPDRYAYVIFTSGSTGNPKGVPITHSNLCPLLHWGYDILGLGTNDRSLQNLSYYFDWSVWEIFITLTSGASLYLVPDEMLIDPEVIIHFIEMHKISVLHVTPTQYRYYTGAGKVLDSMRFLCIGAEKFTPELLERSIASVSPSCRIFNMYGPTEATIMSAVFEYIHEKYGDYNGIASVPIGTPCGNTRLWVIDEQGKPCYDNEWGELYIEGDCVSKGYLNNPELTSERFLFIDFTGKTEDGSSIAKPVFYRTGDRVRRLFDGNIEYLERIDQQVKIRGFRIELGEIQNRMLDFPGVREAVVSVRDSNIGEKYLCGYIVWETEPENQDWKEQFKAFLLEGIPEYMVPAYFVEIEKIPLNPNGKIDMKALPEPRINEREREYVAPGDPVEETMVGIWSEVLGQNKAEIGIHDDFFEIGGHSLRAAVLVTEIHRRFGVRFGITSIFENPTVHELGNRVKESKGGTFTEIENLEEKEYYQISPPQRRVYVVDRMAEGTTAYNITMLWKVKGTITIHQLESAIHELVMRHDSLRTSFELVGNDPVQRIHKDCPFKIEEYRLTEPIASQIGNKIHHSDFSLRSFIRPFKIEELPLFRMGFIHEPDESQWIMMDIHHIVSDGTSMEILRREIEASLDGVLLEKGKIQYRDYAEWQTCPEELERKDHSERYWLDVFKGELPVMNIPLDFARDMSNNDKGNSIGFNIDSLIFEKLKKVCERENITLYMLLFGAFGILMNRLSGGAEDIIIGTPAAGRSHPDAVNLIGMFINTLAFRIPVEGSINFSQYLNRLKTIALKGFEHQEYPYEELVEKLGIEHEYGRNLLFDVVFAHQNMEIRESARQHVQLEAYLYQGDRSRSDLILFSEEINDSLYMFFEYKTGLFKESSIYRFIDYYNNILRQITQEEDFLLNRIDIVGEEERQQILQSFNCFEEDYIYNKTVIQLFEDAVERGPDRLAVVFSPVAPHFEMHITYRHLKTLVYRFTNLIKERGIQPGDFIAMKLPRSTEMIISILGIWKAGCAYVPMNPKNPDERIRFIIEESGSKLLVDELFWEEEKSKIISSFIQEENSISENQFPSEFIAYIIYTSGSTGNPKGVPISHSNLCPLLHWGFKHMPLGFNDKTIQNLSYFFDWSVWEMFITLTSGAVLNITNEDVLLIPVSMTQYLKKHDITTLHITPTQYQGLIGADIELKPDEIRLGSLKYLAIGAEKLTLDIVKRSKGEVRENCRIYNMYGPTEATIMAAVLDIIPSKIYDYEVLNSVPIGVPIANNRLIIVDRYMNLCPLKVVGELLIGGSGVGRGYLNNPELSGEKFIIFDVPGILLNNTRQCQAGLQSSTKVSYNDDMASTFLTKSFTNIYYKTGDLARWVEGGEIEFLGRQDLQVKIRGYRIELGEIENKILENNEVKSAVITVNGSDRLCAYVVAHPQGDKEEFSKELRRFVALRLPAYMIPSYFVVIDELPLNPNGKVDMKALPDPGVGLRQNCFTPPETEIERKLVQLWSSVLQVEAGNIGIDDSFFELGGHSLKATVLIARIQKEYHVGISLADLFGTPTIRALAWKIRGGEYSQFIELEQTEEREYYKLSSPQERLYVLYVMNPSAVNYNMPAVFTMEGNVDPIRIKEAFFRLITRHESLRTAFHIIRDLPVQRIFKEVEFDVNITDLSDSANKMDNEAFSHTIEETIENFIRPFDLANAPMLRIGLIKLSNVKYILMMDMHHIIFDGQSNAILIKEFLALYRGEELHSLPFQYRDFSEWQQTDFFKEQLKKQEKFWLDTFKGGISVADIPGDFERPQERSYYSNILEFNVSADKSLFLRELAKRENITMFMAVLALLNILLSKIGAGEDIPIGTITAGRRHPDLEHIIGMFIDTLVLRNFPTRDKRFIEFVREVGARTLDAFDNQDYPFDDIVEKLGVKREASRNPLFDVLYLFGSGDTFFNANLFENIEKAGLNIRHYKWRSEFQQQGKFDLLFTGSDNGEYLHFFIQYSVELFKQETIERFILYFQEIVSQVVENESILLSNISISHHLTGAQSTIYQNTENEFDF